MTRSTGERMRFLGHLGFVLALIAGFVLLTGCGETVIDTSKIEDQSRADLNKQLPKRLAEGAAGKKLQQELGVSPDERVSSVDCPSGIEVEVGKTFSCDVVFESGQAAIQRFRILNSDADVEATFFGAE